MPTDKNHNEPPADHEGGDDSGMHEASRRAKLEKITQLGHDPWGGRFDDRQWIGDIRAMADQVVYQLASGRSIPVPAPGEEGLDLRAWKAEQGAGELVGPRVRAAGRIVLSRDKGKLKFIDIRDWTGDIQLFVGQKQVGEEDFALADQFDLGDIIGVDGQLRRTNTGELTIFAEKLHFLCKSHRAAAGEAQGPEGPGTAAADAVPGPGLHRRRPGAVSEPHEDRAVDSQHAGGQRVCGSRRADACTPSRVVRRRGRS